MIAGGMALALVCWWLTFGFAWGNFWVKIALSVSAVCAYSLIWHRPHLQWSWTSLAWGAASAAALYGIFVAGNSLGALVFPDASVQVNAIYALGNGTSRVAVFFLLLFITGPGEEIFWRGFVQHHLMTRWGTLRGVAATTTVYAGVHIFSLNPMLIAAAFVAGIFWGALYAWRKDLLCVIVSHSSWSAVIFAVAPVS